ncbi:hypothetical protein LCGC14_2820380, partial [marine sediment metagenome]
VQDHPVIERRSDLTAAGIPPDLIGGLLDGLVRSGLLAIGGNKYTDLAHTSYLLGDGGISKVLSGVKGMKKTRPQMLDMVSKLAVDFPLVNILEQVEHWAAYKLDHPLTTKSNVASQLHTWMKKSLEYNPPTAPPVTSDSATEGLVIEE